jgi:hypothetical protein
MAYKIGKGIVLAEGNFEAQKKIIDILNVQATLSVVNGKKAVSAECELGPLGEPCNTVQQQRH